MVFFEDPYLNILSVIVIIGMSTCSGYFLRGLVRNGRKNQNLNTGAEILIDLLISFIIGFICIAIIYVVVNRWFM